MSDKFYIYNIVGVIIGTVLGGALSSVIQIIITIIFMIVTDFDIITKLVGCVIIGFIELFIYSLIEIYMFRWYDD